MNLTDLKIKGEVKTDLTHRVLYSTDASAYCLMPLGVAYPADSADVVEIVRFARQNAIPIIPRAAGTSLAGQVVGKGLVVEISRHLNRIIEINKEERWVKVQPGVVREELNAYLKQYGLFFGPETSTSNRCCIGGMAGNNSCGSHSLFYGNTRDNLLEATVVLSDGSTAVFKALTPQEVKQKATLDNLEGQIYREITEMLSDEDTRKIISDNYPDPTILRRNTGYALDELSDANCFSTSSPHPFNLCKILAGSEGTLAFATELKLNLVPIPKGKNGVICVHCHTLSEAFDANLVALRYNPSAVELIDRTILQLSKNNITQNRNRFFLQGDPAALLVIELQETSDDAFKEACDSIISALRSDNLGYAYPIIEGDRINAVWNLRKAGLGLLSGTPGSRKPVGVIEDTAVAPAQLKQFHRELKQMLDSHGLSCVYYAHIGSGELHLRPILDLKEDYDRQLFRTVARETAVIVRKYRGSLSGEHGDGRLRGEFLPIVLGEDVYEMLKTVKKIFDPHNIFNPGKIVDAPPMNTSLRYRHSPLENLPTYFDFSSKKGYVCAIEQCNGSADCRRSGIAGGVMCPSFRATHDETHATRARANFLRYILTDSGIEDPFSSSDALQLLSTCLSCKACKAECPSNIDLSRLKAEFLQHHYDRHAIPLRVRLISALPAIQRIGMLAPSLYNAVMTSNAFSTLLKHVMHFAPQRELPRIARHTLRHHTRSIKRPDNPKRAFYLFIDEFSNYEDVKVGIDFIHLMSSLGYEVRTVSHADSGRIQFSMGLLKKARRHAEANVRTFRDIISADTPLVGIEPSCILAFRDEYPDIVGDELKDDARRLSHNALLYDEFICHEIDAGRILSEQFTDAPLNILLHGHCHQKVLASVEASKRMLELPPNYHCEIVDAACCGMAGAFGYDKLNYELSMRIGEETLFPAIRKAIPDYIISAPGTSCRQQIRHATQAKPLHPVSILLQALLEPVRQ